MPADYHTHTPLCKHAEGEPEAYIDAAIAAKVSEYGISDHAPQRPEPFDDWRMLVEDLPIYIEWITKAQAHAGDRLAVRAGLECDWLPDCQQWIIDLHNVFDWDHLIGSIHYLDGWDFDNPTWLGRWAETDVEDAWTTYWKEYEKMAQSGLFDFLGHPDLIKKFSYQPKGDLKRFYEPTIQALVDTDSAIELNTAGFHKPCAEQYPSFKFLELAASAKIPITLSSDAHAPTEVARDFDKGVQLLKDAGFTSTCLFQKRLRGEEPLV
ncbi:histidinol-phosphatase [Akkermansiaceae bacterium]|nr:histidinol-phosphatase [Akkermansiaceae bacterium]MDB4435866.1 histidinol-phosphatase [Akkermansiaceae bacterium]MDB4500909.1 histidinol-phosphatase [Akkermansiaceae bacterium]